MKEINYAQLQEQQQQQAQQTQVQSTYLYLERSFGIQFVRLPFTAINKFVVLARCDACDKDKRPANMN